MTEDLILYLGLTPHYKNNLPNLEIKFNNQVIPTPVFSRDIESKLEYSTTLELGNTYSLTMELKDKTTEDDVIDQHGNVFFSHGVIINSIAFGWPVTDKDRLFIEWMSDNKGYEDNTGRHDQEYERQAEVKKQSAANSTFTRFALNDNMVIKSCNFVNNSGRQINVTPKPNRVFKINENGTFTFSFKPPFAYWALQNFI
jgi:hypothetical protein